MAETSSLSMPGADAYIKSTALTTKSAIHGKDATKLGMNDFFNLLAAQMQNQDMFNPQENTEFIAQMAQFTTLQGLQAIQEYQLSSYATSYVGKNVAIAYTGESGNLTKAEGVVERVTFYDGEPKVVVSGVSYPLYAVMEVKMPAAEDTGEE